MILRQNATRGACVVDKDVDPFALRKRLIGEFRADNRIAAPCSPRASAICKPRPRDPPGISAHLPFQLESLFYAPHFQASERQCDTRGTKPLTAKAAGRWKVLL
jgi:hypothetical protein